ncbi:MAG: flagellar hook-basal body protein [Clostridia bacterium]|nr:flagellar hook-basal body protein [Clostridia bacterium]
MYSGFYTLASGILTRQNEIDILGNNLTNIKTPGYKADRVETSAFEMELMVRMENGQPTVLGDGVGQVSSIVQEVHTIMDAGIIEQTNRELDVAVNGDGFFNIRTADGQLAITKNGNFDLDEQGYLCLQGVGRVLGQNGEIYIGQSGFTIAPNGAITSADGNYIDTLLINKPAEGIVVTKLENSAFLVQGAGDLVAAENYTVIQGALETSNVDMNTELTKLIEAQRSFQLYSSAMQIVDQMDQNATTKLASV